MAGLTNELSKLDEYLWLYMVPQAAQWLASYDASMLASLMFGEVSDSSRMLLA